MTEYQHNQAAARHEAAAARLRAAGFADGAEAALRVAAAEREAAADKSPWGDMDKCPICKTVGDHSLSCPTRWYR